jgi:hypothetical protein
MNRATRRAARTATRRTKREQRDSTLPPGHGGKVLDKLLLLEKVIPRDQVLQVLRDTGCLDSRRCTLTFEVTCWLVLAMGILTNIPLRAVFKASRSLHKCEDTPHRSSLSVARQRLGIAPLRRLFYLIARPLATEQTPGAFYKGHRKMAVDAVVMTVPDTDANVKAFGRSSGGRGEAAFPQVRKLSMIEVGTHAEVAFVAKGFRSEGGRDEQSLMPALLKHLRQGMLLMWDSGLYSFELWRQAVDTGGQLLVRLSSVMHLPVHQQLSDGSYLSKVYPSTYWQEKDRYGISVRVICYTHDDPRRVNCQVEHRLLTTLLDPIKYPAVELICLYHERWEIELVYDEQKTHQHPKRAEKPTHLRSETPAGVIQELYALSLGHYMTRALMVQAAEREDLDPDRLSFLNCLRVLRDRMVEYACKPAGEREDFYEAILEEMSKERTDPRRNRINPRVVKVKMSKFDKKKPEHKGIPKLEKTFEQSIVLLGTPPVGETQVHVKN